MSAPPFVHLHCHSHFSLLDGASPIKGLVDRAKALGMNALALTDHGNLYGALEFYKKARDAGINPILGYEAYIAPGSRFHKEAGGMKEASYHLTLLAQNRTGFQEPGQAGVSRRSSKAFISSRGSTRNCSKSTAKGSSASAAASRASSAARSAATTTAASPTWDEADARSPPGFTSVFGDRYFIEIQNNGLEIQRLAMEGAVEVARRMGLPLVATSDAHYVNREDAEAQDVLLCINTGKFRTDTNRMRMEGDQFFLRSPEEMYAALPGYEEALRAKPADRRLGRHRARARQAALSHLHAAAGENAAGLPARAVPRRA